MPMLVFNTSLYCLLPIFICSYVAVSRPCCLPEFYPNRASTRPTSGWEAGEGAGRGMRTGRGRGEVGERAGVWGIEIGISGL